MEPTKEFVLSFVEKTKLIISLVRGNGIQPTKKKEFVLLNKELFELVNSFIQEFQILDKEKLVETNKQVLSLSSHLCSGAQTKDQVQQFKESLNSLATQIHGNCKTILSGKSFRIVVSQTEKIGHSLSISVSDPSISASLEDQVSEPTSDEENGSLLFPPSHKKRNSVNNNTNNNNNININNINTNNHNNININNNNNINNVNNNNNINNDNNNNDNNNINNDNNNNDNNNEYQDLEEFTENEHQRSGLGTSFEPDFSPSKPPMPFMWTSLRSSTPAASANLLALGPIRSAGFHLELGTENPPIGLEASLSLFEKERHCAWYKHHFVGRNHRVLMANSSESVYVIAFLTPEANPITKALIFSKNGTERVIVPSNHKTTKEAQDFLTQRLKLDVVYVTSIPEVQKKLVEYESANIVQGYKIGILYATAGQTEESDMFSNCTPSRDFQEFLDWIGTKVALKGWEKFRGGLDTKSGTTGTHSVYTQLENLQVMFHVSTMLPFQEKDSQRIERKRHLGNDIVNIIFKEGDQPFNPMCLNNQFNNAWFVVSKHPNSTFSETFYQVAMVCKKGIPPFPPFLKNAPYRKDESFRRLFLTKLVNAERAALLGPDFLQRTVRTCSTLLNNIYNKFVPDAQLTARTKFRGKHGPDVQNVFEKDGRHFSYCGELQKGESQRIQCILLSSLLVGVVDHVASSRDIKANFMGALQRTDSVRLVPKSLVSSEDAPTNFSSPPTSPQSRNGIGASVLSSSIFMKQKTRRTPIEAKSPLSVSLSAKATALSAPKAEKSPAKQPPPEHTSSLVEKREGKTFKTLFVIDLTRSQLTFEDDPKENQVSFCLKEFRPKNTAPYYDTIDHNFKTTDRNWIQKIQFNLNPLESIVPTLQENTFRIFKSSAEEKTFSKGDTIMFVGDTLKYLYIIESGTCRVCSDRRVFYMGPREVMGEQTFLGRPSYENVVVDSESANFLLVEKSVVFSLLKLDPSFALEFFRFVSSKVAYVNYQCSVRAALALADAKRIPCGRSRNEAVDSGIPECEQQQSQWTQKPEKSGLASPPSTNKRATTPLSPSTHNSDWNHLTKPTNKDNQPLFARMHSHSFDSQHHATRQRDEKLLQHFRLRDQVVLKTLPAHVQIAWLKCTGHFTLLSESLAFAGKAFGISTNIVLPVKNIKSAVLEGAASHSEFSRLVVTMARGRKVYRFYFSDKNSAKQLLDAYENLMLASPTSQKLRRKCEKDPWLAMPFVPVEDMMRLTYDDWRQILGMGQRRVFEPGEAMIYKDSSVFVLTFLVSGAAQVLLTHIASDLDRAPIRTLRSGAILGEVSFLFPGTATTAVVASEPNTEVIQIPFASFDALFSQDVSLGARFYAHLCTILLDRIV